MHIFLSHVILVLKLLNVIYLFVKATLNNKKEKINKKKGPFGDNYWSHLPQRELDVFWLGTGNHRHRETTTNSISWEVNINEVVFVAKLIWLFAYV